jgi:hypothetical protein
MRVCLLSQGKKCSRTVLIRIFVATKDEVTGGWGILQCKELRNLYFSLNIVRITKLNRIQWTKHVAYMGEMKNDTTFQSAISEFKRPLGGARCRGILKICGDRFWTESSVSI